MSREAAPPGEARPPASQSRPLSWVVTALVVGWLLVYNVLRIAGDGPRRAAVVAIAPGIGLGLVLFGAGLAIRRALVRQGRLPVRRAEPIGPDPLPLEQRGALRPGVPALGVAALVSVAVGVLLGLDWLQLAAEDRSTTKIALALWDVVVGAWMGAEAAHLAKGHADGLESVALGAVLTAVLAGVALSRSMFPPAQVVLIVVSGAAAVAAQLILRRITGSKGALAGAAAAAGLAVLALIVPLTG